MALVHSRVGRVFFGVEDKQGGGLGGIGNDTSIHSLPGTNHRFRAFRCRGGGGGGGGTDANADSDSDADIDIEHNDLYIACRDL